MEWLWKWGGRCFGYRDEDNLWTHHGSHVGRFHGTETHGPDGRYLGELMSGRLITNIAKKSWRKSAFTPYGCRAAFAKFADYAGYAMYAGYEDFIV